MIGKQLLALLALLLLTSTAHAQRFNKKVDLEDTRDGRWEAALSVSSQDSLTVTGDSGSSLDFDSELGWGFTLGWNWTRKWHLSWKFLLAKPGYTATLVAEDPADPPQTLAYTADRYSNQFNLTYHFLQGRLTPYVQVGAGWAKLDSNIPDRPPATGCWWDPWWGYICATDWSTYDASGFSYNVGLGLRWDLGALFLRGSYSREFFSADRADFDFDTLTLEAGLMW